MAKKTPLDQLLARVELVENPEQEDAATYGVDRLTRRVSVTVNPSLLDAEGQHKAKLRGLSDLILSGFTAYNRDMQRKYGIFPKEQTVHDKAYDEAQEHLVHLLGAAYPFEAPAKA